MTAEAISAIERRLRDEGVVVLEDVYSAAQFAEIKAQYEALHAEFLAALPTVQWTTNRFLRTDTPTFKLDKRLYHEVPMARWGGDGAIIELGPGRYDFSSPERFGSGALGSVWFRYPEPVRALVAQVLGGDYRDSVGALPSNAKSAPGGWHRDIYSLFENEEIDVSLPPFYMTMLVPLVELSAENGATEFILGSHRMTLAQARAKTGQRPATLLAAAKPRSLILFDGRIIHRGGPNTTQEARPVLYLTYTKRWYNDFGEEEPNTLERAQAMAPDLGAATD